MSDFQPPDIDPKWWSNPWWEAPDYQLDYGLSLEQIRHTVERLRHLFDESWVQDAFSAGARNAILPILFGGQGLIPFENLMWLGRIAVSVAPIPTVARPLRELIGPKTQATLFEMEVASWAVQTGWEIEFLKPGGDGKTPDLKVRKGDQTSWIECKRFEPDDWEGWATELVHQINGHVHTKGGSQSPSFDIQFEPRLCDLIWQEDPIRRAVLEEIAVCIADAVVKAFSNTLPTSVRIPNIAEIRVRNDWNTTQRAIGGIQISPRPRC